MLEIVPLTLITLFFLLVGGIKGFTGLGITIISIALLTAIAGFNRPWQCCWCHPL